MDFLTSEAFLYWLNVYLTVGCVMSFIGIIALWGKGQPPKVLAIGIVLAIVGWIFLAIYYILVQRKKGWDINDFNQ